MARESVKSGIEHAFLRTRGDDRPLSELARRQFGVVSRDQLLSAGWSRDEVNWRIRAGRLHRLDAGVYAVGHRVLARQSWWMAAVLASGPEAVLRDRPAAALWGLRGYS